MSEPAAKPPKPTFGVKTMVPTLNGTGFMFEVRDGYAEEWIHFAGRCPDPVLEIGCAYGVSTIPALEAGARVTACDMEPGHLAILEDQVPASLRPNLTCVAAALPEVDFEHGRYGAILCSRVLHFLTGEEIRASLSAMRRWLRPGGRLFVIADTPYSGFWSAGAAGYEQRKAAGEEWPGFIPDIGVYLKGGQRPAGMLAHLNPLDPDLLRRECERAGFSVEEAAFTGRNGDETTRHHAGAIAVA